MKNKLLQKLGLITILSLAGIFTACGETTTSTPTSSVTTQQGPVDPYNCITIAEAIEIAKEAGSAGTSTTYFLRGVITNIENFQYGAMTIEDSTGSIYIYGVYGKDGEYFDALENRPAKGDEIVIEGKLKLYKDTPEMDKATLHELKKNEQPVDLSTYKEVTVKGARDAKVDDKVIIEGVVAKITYANGMVPNGVYIVDNTASIYVYSSDIATQVKIGNKIRVAGTRTLYILDSEKSLATKHGYQGSIQLQEALLVENKGGEHEFDKTWIKEKTVKEMMDTPLTDNITTDIYKVNALVKEVPGSGFTNFYFFDIDGETGSYTYTSCNGDDFTYLREFDNKICTVYLSIINAKATAAKAIYRFMPIAVEYEDYKFDEKDAAQYALTYKANEQFRSYYASGSSVDVLSSVSNSMLFDGDVKLTYTSKDTSKLTFTTENDVTKLNAIDGGEVDVEIKATYKTFEAKSNVKILVKVAPQYTSISVKEAIEASKGTEVTIRAIAGPSLVNQTGFYLIDETGAIAVRLDASLMSEIAYGNEIAIKGTRDVALKDGKTDMFGQSYINVTEIIFNYGGENEYSKASFKSETIDNIVASINDVASDKTTTIYKTKAKIVLYKDKFSETYNLYTEDGSSYLGLYSASGSQYSGLLKEYENKVVEVEVALCNWNSKSPYKGCLLSVIDNGETIPNLLNY